MSILHCEPVVRSDRPPLHEHAPERIGGSISLAECPPDGHLTGTGGDEVATSRRNAATEATRLSEADQGRGSPGPGTEGDTWSAFAAASAPGAIGISARMIVRPPDGLYLTEVVYEGEANASK